MYHRPLIGFTGRAQAGKDTAAQALVRAHGYTQLGFADTLKEMALAVDPYVTDLGRPEPRRLSQIVATHGWETAKQIPEVRQFLQCLGTEAGRGLLGDDIWVRTAIARIDRCPSPVTLADVRFPNEADAIRARQGHIIRIHRPTHASQIDTTHASETAADLIRPDRTIHNTGTIQDLQTAALQAHQALTGLTARSVAQ